MPSSEIAAAHIEHLAIPDQDFHCLPDFFPRCAAVDVMHLVQIDVIGLHPLEAAFDCHADMIGGEPALVGAFSHPTEDFRRKDDLLTPPTTLSKPSPDDVLGDAFPYFPTIDVGSIEEIDAKLQ